ncbi:MAG TPA: EAL domain-containing protein [Albitalea sp.]|uniref:EAL domain-containing protein n=1 Tax=Piscinibacter sp. TaxID=1903157 RepID=UPI002ED379A0
MHSRTRLDLANLDLDDRERLRLALEALRDSEARLRDMARLSAERYWEQDESFRFVAYPGRASDAADHELGKTLWELPVSGVTRAQWQAHRDALAAHRPFRDFVYQRRDLAGEPRTVSASGVPVFDESGRFCGYRGIARDVTARQRDESLVRLEHIVARRLAAADDMPSALASVIQALCETEHWEFGRCWRVDEAAGVLRFAAAWHDPASEIAPYLASAENRVFRPGEGLVGQVWKSGEPLWVTDLAQSEAVRRTILAPGMEMHGACVFPVVSRDTISGVMAFVSREVRKPDERLLEAFGVIGSQVGQFMQRKHAERVTIESEARFRSLTELSSDFYWETDAEHRMVDTTHGPDYQPVVGGRQAGRTRWEMPSTRPDAAGWAAHRAVLDAHEPFRDFEFARLDQEGNERHLSINGKPMFDEAGAFMGYRGTGRDVTAGKRAGQAIQRHALQQSLIAAFGQRALANSRLDDLMREATEVVVRGLDVERCLVLQGGSAPPPHASAAEVAIAGSSGTFGMLGAYAGRPRSFSPENIDFLQSVANTLATAIDRRNAEERMAFLAQFDALTGLANRTLLLDRFVLTLAQARRHGWLAGVLFVDLDRFKVVNDTLGHAAGDALLGEVAARLKDCVRASDTVGRLGGDEFACVLSELSRPADAALVAEKVVRALSQPFMLDSEEVCVSASVGIGLYPTDGDDADTLLRHADTAMYRAKEEGRNGFQFYLPQMNDQALERLQLQAQLRNALERREFVLHYQPKASLASGEISGFEALLRWQHPVRGLVPPTQFIAILEDTGLIVPVGDWVVRTVCEQLVQWRAQGLAVRPVAVNLSARQFQQRNLDASIATILENTGVDGALLELELTESMLMTDPDAAVRMLANVRACGVRLSVDDFGTGYSSLSHLKRFPLDALKIDRAFIRDVITDPDDAAITVAIIGLARSLGLKVVAEGVETEAQLEFLRTHGCDEIQGYLFARPMPVGDCTQALMEGRRLLS